ncbi:MAG TPA: hypothetical protein DCG57_06175 [Candidatus Riflebacteria bacterium]|nr:hypothetical protein [Candidatus Riflebacteria bacterium]
MVSLSMEVFIVCHKLRRWSREKWILRLHADGREKIFALSHRDTEKKRASAVAHRMWVILGRIRMEAPG